MKVVLAHRCPDDLADQADAQTVPAGLRWMAASLRAAGHEALVANFSRLGWRDVEKYLTAEAPQVVGVSCLTAGRATAARLARLARRCVPGATVAMGGPHASAIPDLLLRRVRELDFVVVGEGELPMLAACEALGRGQAAALSGIAGIAVRGIPAARPAAEADLEKLPRPVRGVQGAGLDPVRDFRHVVASRARATGVARRSPGSVVREMKELREEFGVIEVCLVGPGLWAAQGWIEDLATLACEERLGMAWDVAAEPRDLAGGGEAVTRALGAARRAGCRRLRLRLDARDADPALVEPLERVSGLLRHAGIAAHLTVSHALPGQTPAQLALTRSLVRALRPREGALEPIELLPGSVAWEAHAAEAGLDDRFWFDESRPVLPAASPREVEVSEGALELTLREVARSARPAARDLEVLDANDLSSAWSQLEWGDWRASLGDLEEAERHYRVAAEREPASAFPWLRLAALFARGRAVNEAGAGREAAPQREMAALRQALSRVPRHAEARARLERLRGAEREGRRPPGRSRRRRSRV